VGVNSLYRLGESQLEVEIAKRQFFLVVEMAELRLKHCTGRLWAYYANKIFSGLSWIGLQRASLRVAIAIYNTCRSG